MEPTPRTKAHSYSHQLSTNTRTHHKCYHQFRHHSFDIPTNIIQNNHGVLMYEDSSSDDEDFYPYSTYSTTTGASTTGHVFDAAGKGLKTVDDDINEQQALPEFVGGDGEVGIFKVQTRASVGKFLRTIACTETQLWAGLECGIRVWNFSDQ
ncbi:hypothetical protein RND71_021957 [Anisodus tanguticus]|uniref:IP5PC-F beta-propeller domain-containing protein n=1 Tax=Anisodus tanguticus TaxID=243964 RepID=A0AAE1RXJ1_9SOLA|nr:hypothetical protein RND71_021957 [Anisodus tanguticus]